MATDPNDIVLSVRDLVVRFDRPDGDGQITVLSGVTFDVIRGETLVIMGGSGCGKSTLLNCLIGEILPSEGEIIYRFPDLGEADLLKANAETRDTFRKRFGILFQSGALFSSMTVAENVALPLEEHSHVDQEVIDIVVAMKLQQVHMLEHRDKKPAQLSGGQKKRAGLARATALDPEILYYDEPSAGLDPVTSTAIDQLMMDLSQKLQVTSIVVTHEMDSAFRIADRMVMLEKGRVLRVGTRQEIDALRLANPQSLASRDERLMHQFLNGDATGPLTDASGTSLYEKLLVGGVAVAMSDGNAVLIRGAHNSDYPAIIELWTGAGLTLRLGGRDAEPEFQRQLKQFPTTFLVAENAGKVVGVVLGTHDFRKGWLNRLAVRPDRRRRGIGLGLLHACERALHAQGIVITAALTERTNTASANLLAKAGYSDELPVRYFRKPLHVGA